MGRMERSFGLVASQEELALRRRLRVRLLRGFDFDAPEFRGEMITEPATVEQLGEAMRLAR